MASNFLEQLAAEWYESQGFIVRRNVLVGKRAKGGYEGELDIVGYQPLTGCLVHVEASMDALSWAKRERGFARKFELGRVHFRSTFPDGLALPDGPIEQIALLAFASKKNHETVGGGTILLLSELVQLIFEHLDGVKLESRAIPENLPLLRAYQVASDNRRVLLDVWSGTGR